MKRCFNPGFIFLLCTLLFATCSPSTVNLEVGDDFPAYGGGRDGNRYSPLDQINLENVEGLKVAWIYDASSGDENETATRMIQCQPIVVHGILYGTSPDLNLFALNSETGQELWRFKPLTKELNVNRGVSYWEEGSDKRIIYSAGSDLYAVNADNGNLIRSFGDSGIVDLHEGLDKGQTDDISSLSVRSTSPGVIYKNIYITGSSVAEDGSAAPGHIRGFDVKSGKLLWIFKTIPHPGEEGYDTWPKDAYKFMGGANNWAGLVVDEKRGAVYFGTGSPSNDFYGGNRAGANLFANCVISLNAETGKLNWYFQTIHHDLWDRDIPMPPNLTTITQDGVKRDVLVQATKDGLVYVLDRDDGTSIYPIEEKNVPTDNALPGEVPYPTQKFPSKPAPLSRQVFTENDISDISPQAHEFTKQLFEKYPTPHKFTPPNEKGIIAIGYSGGPEWGGGAVDPTGIYYQTANQNPWIVEMIDSASRNRNLRALSKGEGLYMANCSACHGEDRKGSGSVFPSLINIGQKFSVDKIQDIVKSGRGRMPSFQQLSQEDRTSIVNFIVNPNRRGRVKSNTVKSDSGEEGKESRQTFGFEPAYLIKEWKKIYDPDGYPGIKPPWGVFSAIDLNTGDYLWSVPLGEFEELTKKGIPLTGTEIYGGPLVTASNLIFIAGTRDEKIRALNKKTGNVVWEYKLPAAGFATPITYMRNGKQYIVIAAGGGRGLKLGGKYIAFTLP